MDAFLAVEEGDFAVRVGRDGLCGTGFGAGLGGADFAEVRVEKLHVVRVSVRGLHFPAQEQRVLLGDKNLAVEFNFGPPGAFHEGVVQMQPLGLAFLADTLNLVSKMRR